MTFFLFITFLSISLTFIFLVLSPTVVVTREQCIDGLGC